MKKTILLFIAGVGLISLVLMRGTKGMNVATSVPSSLGESGSHLPAVPSARAGNNAQTVSQEGVKQVEVAYPIAPTVAQGLALTNAEATALNNLFRQKREDVLREFAKHSQLAKLGDRGVQVAVAMPKEQADALRAGFYADMAEIIGQERLARFMGTENLGRFEAHFEFFGTLPMVYEFEGDRTLLARSEVVNFRTNVARSDQYGPYNSYIAGKYGLSEFQREFGAVADLAISQQPSS